jgi:hypothetical protein
LVPTKSARQAGAGDCDGDLFAQVGELLGT